MNKTFKYLTRLFFHGLVIVAPIAITAYVLYFIFKVVDGLIPWIPGVSFVLVIAIVTFVGFLGTQFFIGRWLVEGLDYIFDHTPGIKIVYSSVKDIINSFMGDKKKFNNPVWVKVQDTPEMWRIGFVTQKKMDESALASSEMVAVYLPLSYAISGWVIIVAKSQTHPVTSMNAVEAMKFAVSGGITGRESYPAGHSKK